MQTMQIVKTIKLDRYIYRPKQETEIAWLVPGEYKVRREFDENRYLVDTGDGITLVQKSLTIPVA